MALADQLLVWDQPTAGRFITNNFELKVGVEPTTCGLRNRCSTTELLQLIINLELFETH